MPAGAFEKSEGTVVSVGHHLVRLTGIGAYEHHRAVAEPNMLDLHGHRHAAQQDDLVALVKLIGFSRSKGEGDVSYGRRLPMLPEPWSGISTHAVAAAVIASTAQILEDPDQRQLLASRLDRVPGKQPLELFRPSAELRSGLDLTLIPKGGLARPQNLADRVPGDMQVPREPLDRLALEEMLPPNPANRLHRQHAPAARSSMQAGSPSA